jgi:ATP synthase protein I
MDSQSPSGRKDPGGTIKQVALGFELPFMLVAPVLLGAGVGYVLDHWLHTKPVLMVILGILGVGIGIRDTLKAASAGDKKS